MKSMARCFLALLCVGVLAKSGLAQSTLRFSLDQLFDAHGSWPILPLSIQITGISIRGDVREPVTITATSREEKVVQYGDRKSVATPWRNFQADASKVNQSPTLSGFSQLDVTGIFMLAQFRSRRLLIGAPERVALADKQVMTRVRIRGERTETHYRRFIVPEQFDLYIGDGGLLEGISRTFYEEEPRWQRTLAVRFGDYRKTGMIQLPYRIEQYEDGRLTETIVVNAYAVDVPAGASLFEQRRVR